MGGGGLWGFGLSSREEQSSEGRIGPGIGRKTTIEETRDLLNDLRGNDLARSAPGGEAIDDHHARLGERFLELVHAASPLTLANILHCLFSLNPIEHVGGRKAAG